MKLHSLRNIKTDQSFKCFACNAEPAVWYAHLSEGVVTVNLCLGSKCAAKAMSGTLDLGKWTKKKGDK